MPSREAMQIAEEFIGHSQPKKVNALARAIDELRVRDLEQVANTLRASANMSFQGTFGMGYDSACIKLAEWVEHENLAALRAAMGEKEEQR